MKFHDKLRERFWRFYRLPHRVDSIQESLGRIESRLMSMMELRAPIDFADCEFKVYSQWGEDGIIDQLIRRMQIPNKAFVEFGVENYLESNTLFLLKHRYWHGLIIDGSQQNIDEIRGGHVFWKFDLTTICAFITAENINALIQQSGLHGDIGLLSVDIDGNDYWVWKAIDCVSPRIVIAEYNSLFGPTAKVSIPYNSAFQRTVADRSNLFFGASLAALTHQAQQRGYSLVASTSIGNNAFFVRNDCMDQLTVRNVEDVYVKAPFRESRGSKGVVEHLTFEERQRAILDHEVVEVVSESRGPLRMYIDAH